MTTFTDRQRAVRARINPFDLEETRIMWTPPQSCDEDATPTMPCTRISLDTEPKTAIVQARQAANAERVRQQAKQREQQDDLTWAVRMGLALVGLALWLWLLAAMPIHWTR